LTTNSKKRENRLLELFTGADGNFAGGSNGIVSGAAVVLGFLFASLLLFAIGRNPAGMYQSVLQVITGYDSRRGTWNIRYIGEWLVVSVPLILCALSMGFAARSGLFNIGAEGQYIAGLTAAQITAIKFAQIPVLHWAAAVTAGIIAAAAWGGIAGFLKVRYKVSEVVSTIMMNYIALYTHRIITMNISGSSTFRTPDFPVTASISSQLLSSLTNGSRLNYGFWFAAAAVFIYWLILEKTTFGFSLRVCGFNRDAAEYAGINVNFNSAAAMAIAGAFAGLAGSCTALGMFSHGRVLTAFDNYGFDAIAAALGGSCTTAGITVMGLLFGMLRSAGPVMQSRQIPSEITSIIIGLVVVFISLRAGIRLLVEHKMKRNILRQKINAQGEHQ
jgi:simple sugar transport system permease protein